MVICFRCSPDTKRLLDQAVRESGYADYAAVIEAAVANLAVLERSVSRGALVVESPLCPSQTSVVPSMRHFDPFEHGA